MAQRTNHYDAAFEEYLRATRTAYVVVDEKRRSLLQEASLKSMDFIAYSRRSHNLLVDVKGRRYPSGTDANPHKWENWTTAEDIQSLLQWQEVFGEGFRSVFVFAYHVVDSRFVTDFDQVFDFRERTYAFYGIWVDEYQAEMRTRSISWETVSLPSSVFRKLRLPIEAFL